MGLELVLCPHITAGNKWWFQSRCCKPCCCSRQQSRIPLPPQHCGKSGPEIQARTAESASALSDTALPHQVEFDLWRGRTTPWTEVGHCDSAVRQKVHQTVRFTHTGANRSELAHYGRADPGAEITEDGDNSALRRIRHVHLPGLSSHHNTALKAPASIYRWSTQGDRVEALSVGVMENAHGPRGHRDSAEISTHCLLPGPTTQAHAVHSWRGMCISIMAIY